MKSPSRKVNPQFLESEMKNIVVKNEGAGWYAPRQAGQYENQSVEWYWVGGDYDFAPDVYIHCLGSPVWVDDPAELEYSETDEPVIPAEPEELVEKRILP